MITATVTDRALASALRDLKLSGMLATLDARLAQAGAVRQRDGLAVPAVPVSCHVAGDQEDRLAPGVEREQQPDLGCPGRRRPQLFYLVVTAALDPVSQWPPQGRAFGGELVDSVLDEIGGLGSPCRAQIPTSTS